MIRVLCSGAQLTMPLIYVSVQRHRDGLFLLLLSLSLVAAAAAVVSLSVPGQTVIRPLVHH